MSHVWQHESRVAKCCFLEQITKNPFIACRNCLRHVRYLCSIGLVCQTVTLWEWDSFVQFICDSPWYRTPSKPSFLSSGAAPEGLSEERVCCHSPQTSEQGAQSQAFEAPRCFQETEASGLLIWSFCSLFLKAGNRKTRTRSSWDSRREAWAFWSYKSWHGTALLIRSQLSSHDEDGHADWE